MSEFTILKLDQIKPSETNPRKEFDEDSLQDLAASIKEHGVLQPIIVRKGKEVGNAGNKKIVSKYELVCGERRWRASAIAKMKDIPVVIRDLKDEEVLEIQILENLQREDVSPMDEARAFQTLLGKESLDWLASKINKSKKYVLDRIKLLDLNETFQQDLAEGKLPIGHALLLSRLEPGDQLGWSHYERYTQKDLKEAIRRKLTDFENAYFDLEDEKLLPNVGSCQNCPKRTINHQLLFADITSDDRCTDAICFDAKNDKYFENQKAEAQKKYGKQLLNAHTSYNGVVLNDDFDKYPWLHSTEFSESKEGEFDTPVYIEDDGYVYQVGYTELKGKVVFIKSKALEEPKKEHDAESVNSSDNWRLQNVIKYTNITAERINTLSAYQLKTLSAKIMLRGNIMQKLIDSSSLEGLIIICNWLGIQEIEPTESGGEKLEIPNLLEYDLEHYFTENQERFTTKDEKYQQDKMHIIYWLNSIYAPEELNLIAEIIEVISTEDQDEAPFVNFDGDTNFQGLKMFLEGNLKIDEKIERKCRECGCTDDDCEQCIEKTGEACYWVEWNLCSACVENEEKEKEEEDEEPVSFVKSNIKGDPSGLAKLLKDPESSGDPESAVQLHRIHPLPEFEKVEKKYALNNSYFKNRYPEYPSNPFEVYAYYEQHGELPFDVDPETNPNWLYDTYVEYQKRAGVNGSEYFTPPATAERIAEIADEYFEETLHGVEILDACCGFGMLTIPLTEKGFLTSGFDINMELVKMYELYTQRDGFVEDINDYSIKMSTWKSIVANPPYEAKECTKFLELLNELLEEGGKAILLLPKGFVDKERPKAIVNALSNFDIIYREDMQEDFARTKVKAEIVLLEKVK